MVAVAGVDGCRGGWVVVTASQGDRATSVEQVPDLIGVVSRLDSGELGAVGIDIPIGLPDSGRRRCDVEVRKMIGPRRSSVFPAPVRAVLASPSYEEALARSRRAAGKGLSRQAFAILPKITEVDHLMTRDRQGQLFEVHPEVCFTVLSGDPMSHHKATPEGNAERLTALRRLFPDVDRGLANRPAGARPDDILDGYVAAWTARRCLDRAYLRLGGDADVRGLRMEMIA